MENLYHWMGLIWFWASVCLVSFYIAGKLFIAIMNWLGRRFSSMWTFLEFMYYREEFLEWVKDKERIKHNHNKTEYL
jgi:hypothetical protein